MIWVLVLALFTVIAVLFVLALRRDLAQRSSAERPTLQGRPLKWGRSAWAAALAVNGGLFIALSNMPGLVKAGALIAPTAAIATAATLARSERRDAKDEAPSSTKASGE